MCKIIKETLKLFKFKIRKLISRATKTEIIIKKKMKLLQN